MADGNYVRMQLGVAFPHRLSSRAGTTCPHPKPRFLNGRERMACFLCRPKAESKQRQPHRRISTRSAICSRSGCGREYVQWLPHERYCSSQCRALIAAERCRKYQQAARDRSARACALCGSFFAPGYGDPRRRFCSKQCRVTHQIKNKSGSTHRRRARLYGVAYERIDKFAVFARDGWKCQLCGVATPRDRSGKLIDTAPQLDHIVPISMGGPHTLENVQCTCRKCNMKKRARPLGQLLLFG